MAETKWVGNFFTSTTLHWHHFIRLLRCSLLSPHSLSECVYPNVTKFVLAHPKSPNLFDLVSEPKWTLPLQNFGSIWSKSVISVQNHWFPLNRSKKGLLGCFFLVFFLKKNKNAEEEELRRKKKRTLDSNHWVERGKQKTKNKRATCCWCLVLEVGGSGAGRSRP